MKSHSAVHGPKPKARLTRAERRAAERIEMHERAKQHKRAARRGPSGSLIAAGVTVLAVIAVFIYGILRSNASSATASALTDPNTFSPGSSGLSVGQKAPNFTLHDASGNAFSLSTQRGHPVLLEFFAVWCPVCHGEAPIMAGLTKDYVPKGVRVWSVLSDPYGPNYETSNRSDLALATKADLAWYARTYNVHHPQLVDPDFSTVNQYLKQGYPTIYIVNSRGVITFARSGHIGFQTLARALNGALAGTSAGHTGA